MDSERRNSLLDPSPLYNGGSLVEPFLTLPAVRAVWLPSGVDIVNGMTLAANNAPLLKYHNNLTTYRSYNGTNQSSTRADEANLDVIGNEGSTDTTLRGLTVGLWLYLDAATASCKIINKNAGSGNQRSWALSLDGASNYFASVSTDGINNISTANGTSATGDTGQWQFLYLWFNPSNELAIYQNMVKIASQTTGVPATLFNSTAAFSVAVQEAANWTTGRTSVIFLCGARAHVDHMQYVYEQTRKFYS